jgi:hypothetical protein
LLQLPLRLVELVERIIQFLLELGLPVFRFLRFSRADGIFDAFALCIHAPLHIEFELLLACLQVGALLAQLQLCRLEVLDARPLRADLLFETGPRLHRESFGARGSLLQRLLQGVFACLRRFLLQRARLLHGLLMLFALRIHQRLQVGDLFPQQAFRLRGALLGPPFFDVARLFLQLREGAMTGCRKFLQRFAGEPVRETELVVALGTRDARRRVDEQLLLPDPVETAAFGHEVILRRTRLTRRARSTHERPVDLPVLVEQQVGNWPARTCRALARNQ